MTSKKTPAQSESTEQEEGAELDPQLLLLSMLARMGQGPGPLDLQRLWSETVRTALPALQAASPMSAGLLHKNANEAKAEAKQLVLAAGSIADEVVDLFVSRAEDLAKRTGDLPYFEPAPPEGDEGTEQTA